MTAVRRSDRTRSVSGKTRSSGKPTSMSTSRFGPVSHDQIARRAYSLWQERGHRIGFDREDWFEAEAELNNLDRF